MKRIIALTTVALLVAAPAFAEDTEVPPPKVTWTFSGPFGTFDRAQLQRGFQVYTEVCSNCHSMNLLHYRDLEALGYNENEIKAIAAQKQVNTIDDKGETVQRPAQPSDAFVAPFPNEKAARAANGGALPPDQSVLVKALGGGANFLANGADYVHAILTGYREAPKGFNLQQGMNYNEYFPNHQIAMPPPLQDDTVHYGDGTKATLDQEAQDVSAFLAWASEPSMEDRKRTGAKVIIFLLVLAGVLYGAKRRVWADLH
jgi:ubiquinol-cytochrome c reductase cytochrome c1 subunit